MTTDTLEATEQALMDTVEQLSSTILGQLRAQLDDDVLISDADMPAVAFSIVTLVRFVKTLPPEAQNFTVAVVTAEDRDVTYTLNVTQGNAGLTDWTRPTLALPNPYEAVVVWHAVGDVLLERRIAHRCPDDEAVLAESGPCPTDLGLWRLHGDPARMYVPGSHILYWCPLPSDPPDIGKRMNPETGNLPIRQSSFAEE